MKKHAFSAIAAVSLLSVASSALAQTAPSPDRILTESLEVLGKVYGNSQGQITVTDPAGGTQIFALGDATAYDVYYAGDYVYTGDTFAFCVQDSTGGLSYCDPVEPPTAVYCPLGTCHCGGFWECLDLTMSGECDTAIGNCDSYTGCSCENWGP